MPWQRLSLSALGHSIDALSNCIWSSSKPSVLTTVFACAICWGLCNENLLFSRKHCGKGNFVLSKKSSRIVVSSSSLLCSWSLHLLSVYFLSLTWLGTACSDQVEPRSIKIDLVSNDGKLFSNKNTYSTTPSKLKSQSVAHKKLHARGPRPKVQVAPHLLPDWGQGAYLIELLWQKSKRLCCSGRISRQINLPRLCIQASRCFSDNEQPWFLPHLEGEGEMTA